VLPQLVHNTQTDMGQSQLQRISAELCDKKIQGWGGSQSKAYWKKVSICKLMDAELLWLRSRSLQL